MYGGAYDAIVHVIAGWSPLSVYKTRHICNALVGLIGISGVYCLGRTLGSRWTGLLAAVFLVLTPRYYGHSFFNHKDIPFAVGYVWSVYTTIRFLEALPRPTVRSMLACAVAIGVTLGIRVGGLILVGYLGFGVLIWIWMRIRSTSLSLTLGLGVVMRMLAISVTAYAIMLSAWPWAQIEPFTRPFKALGYFTTFTYAIPTFFEGQHIGSTSIPWYYAPKWLLITLPEFLIAGGVLGFVLSLRRSTRWSWSRSTLIFAIAFPLAYSVVKGVPFCNGMRHILFVLPLLAALSAWGMMRLVATLPRLLGPVSVVTGILLLLSVYDLVTLHPNQYAYFNRLFGGGLAAASELYETDYYHNSSQAGLDWLMEHETSTNRTVASAGVIDSDRFERVLVPWKADYFLASTSRDEHLDVSGEVLHVVTAQNVPMLYVIRPDGTEPSKTPPREASAVHYLSRIAEAMAADGRLEEATTWFEEATRWDPQFPTPYWRMGKLYGEIGNWQASADGYERSIELGETLDLHYVQLGRAHRNLGNSDLARRCFEMVLDLRDDHYQANIRLGRLLIVEGDAVGAGRILRRTVDLYPQRQEVRLHLARALVDAGHKEKEVAECELLLKMNPRIENAHKILINLYVERKSWQKAIDALYDALTYFPDDVTYWFVLSDIYDGMGRSDSTEVALRSVLKIDPENTRAKEFLEKLGTKEAL
jgi:tetratricopeptide (TPR) repeat protein